MQEYNLIIDEGNSFAKIAVIDKKESCVVREWVEPLFNNALLEEIIAENGEPKAAIVSSVRGNAAEYAAMLQRAGIERVVIRNTPLEFVVINTADWITDDDSLGGKFGY